MDGYDIGLDKNLIERRLMRKEKANGGSLYLRSTWISLPIKKKR